MEIQGQIVLLFLSDGSKIVGEHLGDESNGMIIRRPFTVAESISDMDENAVFTDFILISHYCFTESDEITFRDSHIMALSKVNAEMMECYYKEVESMEKQLEERQQKKPKTTGTVVPMKRKN